MALNAREKLLLGGLAAVGLSIAGYMLVHEPLTTRRAEARERLDQVENQLVQEQTRLAKEGNLKDRRDNVTAREQMIDSWVPGRNSAALLIWHLSQAEQVSGTRIRAITVGEKSVVNVADKKTGQTAPKQGGQPQPAPQPANPAEDGAGAPETAMTSLVMIPVEMKVDGRFAEHLIFNQYLEEAPLFLNTHGIALTRQGQLPLDKLGKLVQGGSAWLAGQILTASPPVDGVYQAHLYFKATKPGPSTDEMRFDSPAGRIDPFVMAAVDEFIRLLQEHFADQGARNGTSPPQGPDPAAPRLPGYGQLG